MPGITGRSSHKVPGELVTTYEGLTLATSASGSMGEGGERKPGNLSDLKPGWRVLLPDSGN